MRATVLSRPFAEFDRTVKEGIDGRVLVEFQLIDIFADLGAYLFARDYLRARGYQVCIDGLHHVHLPLINRRKLGADFVKVQWTPDLLDDRESARLERLKAAGVWVVGLDAAGATPLHDMPFSGDPIVLVLGAEGSGLSRLVRQRCDVLAAIQDLQVVVLRLESLGPSGELARARYELARALVGLDLPVAIPGWVNGDALRAGLRFDKKRRGGRARLALPRRVGEVRYGCEIDEEALWQQCLSCTDRT